VTALNERSVNAEAGLSCLRGCVATPHGAPTEADGPSFRERLVSSVGNREGCGHLSDGSGEREDGMTMLLSLAIVFGTLCCLARPKPLRTVIPSQRLAGLNRPRVR
jgi:hypothetical protein